MSSTNDFQSNTLQRIARVTRKYSIPGINRLLWLLYNPDKRQKDYLNVVINYDADLLIHIDTRAFQEWIIFFHGYYEKEIVNLLKRILKKDFVVFEIGTNIGSHTLIMSKLVGKEGKVFAIEPYPKVVKKLLKNINLNRIENIKYLQIALSDIREKMALFFSNNHFATEDMNASLYPDDRLNEQIEVEVKTLDDAFQEESLNRIDLIKIDTEGNEYKDKYLCLPHNL